MAYLDKAGFAQVHPNRSAWTPVGQQHRIEAIRGKRLNVSAALLSTGHVFSAALWCTFNAFLFVGFLGLLRDHPLRSFWTTPPFIPRAPFSPTWRSCGAKG